MCSVASVCMRGTHKAEPVPAYPNQTDSAACKALAGAATLRPVAEMQATSAAGAPEQLRRGPRLAFCTSASAGWEVRAGACQVLDADDALEHQLRVGVPRAAVHDAGAVDQEDALHEGDVLPHLGLPWNRRCFAHLPTPG